jgi:biotin carboxyl carrier protein
MTQPLHVTALGGNRYAVDEGHRRSLAYAVHVEQATWVFLDGRVWVVQQGQGASFSRTAEDDGAALAAPMPATVVAIEVTVGQQVSRGDILVRLEAMKMELAIKAPRDATVLSVACRPGDFVEPGAPLVALSIGH